MANITLPVAKISDWPSFHAVSADTFGFPDFYGHNNNAWIDCLSYLTDDDGMCSIVLTDGEVLFLNVPAFDAFQHRYPDIAAGLVECVDAVNDRYVAGGDIPRLVLIPQ
ncbi:RNAse (barnase) inhibitor barstar [Xanthomonas sp. 3272]|uniref:barstar family protein n=1 Tax=Xanthomonas arboricola TaxID=56448 RepID=UPI0014316312|nr:barstar family protein [Xanthomonas arboricola]NJC02937.1 RNAse (barnase) inhibitor barstar [Xanthomonas arboricola]